MIVLQEALAVESKVMKHLFPEPAGRAAVDAFEGDLWRRAVSRNDVHVIDAGIALVC